MPKANSALFPAHGNHHGPTAGVKFDFAYDLLAGTIVSHSLQQATEQDKAMVAAEGKTCRLVAMRAALEVVAARRAERRNKAWQSGKQPCPAGLVRDGWHIMLTNLTKEQADVRQLATIYRARWAVAHPLGGGNPIPGMETSAQPRQGAQLQEQSTSSASAGIGGDDCPPTWHEHRTEDQRNDRTGQAE